MITFKNEGGFGPEFSTMNVRQHPSNDGPTMELTIIREDNLHSTIILTKETAMYLSKEIQRVFGKEKEKTYTGTL